MSKRSREKVRWLYRKAREQARNILRQAEQEMEHLEDEVKSIRRKELLLDDLVAFGREICGFRDLNERLHGSVAKFIESGNALVCLLPREHLKSSLITVAYTCQQIAKNPDIRVCIYTVTQDLAQAFLRQIKAVLRSTAFQRCWGERVPPDFVQDTIDALTIRRPANLKEPTVYATSVGASQIGFHFDLNIYDDIVDNRTVMTEGAMARTKQWYRESLALHEKGSKLIFIGTRWHDLDLAGELLRDPSYKCMVRSAIEYGVPIFPEKFDTKRLAQLRERMSRRIFACQYMNDPVPESDQTFRATDLKIVDSLPEGDTYVTVDPSTGQGARIDRSAIVVVRALPNRSIVIADIWLGRPDPGRLIDEILTICERWRPVNCGIERVAYQSVLQYFIEREMIHSDRYFHITPVVPRGRRKDERILALEPFFASGKVAIWSECRWREELIHEMTRFPHGTSDDILDALAYQLDIIRFPSRSLPSGERMLSGRELFAEWYRQKCEEWPSKRKVLGFNRVRGEVKVG